MGNTNAIPIVSQLKSAVQAISGDAEGARKTQEEFSKQCIVVSQARSAVEAVYDADAARRTQLEFANNMESVADGTPLVGHIKGSVHYALGDTEKGDECMKSASRTTAVVVAGVATAGSGWVVAASAGVAAGVVTDGATTGIDSAVHNEYRPSGIIQAGHAAADSGNAGDIFDLATVPVMDGLAGISAAKATKAGSKAKQTMKNIDDAKRAVTNTPEGTVLTKMHGHNGNVVTGVNSASRQGLMKKQFGLSKKQAMQQSRDMPITLRDAHPNPPVPRRGGACAEHHAANKLARVNDTPAESYTVTKTRNGEVKVMKRCDNCLQFGETMGDVMTDSKFPRVRATAPIAGPVVGMLTTATAASRGDEATAGDVGEAASGLQHPSDQSSGHAEDNGNGDTTTTARIVRHTCDVEVGPIFNQRDAEVKANKYIEDHPGLEWTGGWRTTVTGRMSVIQVRDTV